MRSIIPMSFKKKQELLIILVLTLNISWSSRSQDLFSIPEEIFQQQTIHVYENGNKINTFKWSSTETIQKVLNESTNKQTTIYFSPGEYLIDNQINIIKQNNLEIFGLPGTSFSFPNKDLTGNPKLNKEVVEGDKKIYVDKLDFFKPNHRYQIYHENKKGDRILEFRVKKIEDGALVLSRPAVRMKHVKEIPVGSLIYEQHNFFVISRSQNIKITNIILDGGNLGEIYGHTIYSGILVLNVYKDARLNKKATYSGLEIKKCTIRNLRGRGIAVYNMENILIEDNFFENIGVEAIEIDHFSQAIVQNNTIKNSNYGISCNDCYGTIIRHNYLEKNATGIIIRTIYDDYWVNTGNTIEKNQLINSLNNEFSFGIYAKNNSILQNTIQNFENRIRIKGNTTYNKVYNNKIRMNRERYEDK